MVPFLCTFNAFAMLFPCFSMFAVLMLSSAFLCFSSFSMLEQCFCNLFYAPPRFYNAFSFQLLSKGFQCFSKLVNVSQCFQSFSMLLLCFCNASSMLSNAFQCFLGLRNTWTILFSMLFQCSSVLLR